MYHGVDRGRFIFTMNHRNYFGWIFIRYVCVCSCWFRHKRVHLPCPHIGWPLAACTCCKTTLWVEIHSGNWMKEKPTDGESSPTTQTVPIKNIQGWFMYRFALSFQFGIFVFGCIVMLRIYRYVQRTNFIEDKFEAFKIESEQLNLLSIE